MSDKPTVSTSASAVIGFSIVAGLTITSASGAAASVLRAHGESEAPGTVTSPAELSSASTARSELMPLSPTANSGTSMRAASSWAEASSGITKQLLSDLQRLEGGNRAHAVRIADAVSFLIKFPPVPSQTIMDIDCTWCDDGSLLAELMFPNRRIGFSFEKDESKSSWFIASLPPSRIDGSGYLRDINPVAILMRGLSR